MREFDERGLPGAMIATTAFEEAAAAQSASLGFEPAIVYVAHPIQDRTDEELRAIADAALAPVLAAIARNPPR